MWNAKTGRIMGVACLEFRGENFRRWMKNREIRESFLPRKFSAIRYCKKWSYSWLTLAGAVHYRAEERAMVALNKINAILYYSP